ncbi:uncharacterized protein LDX57_009815 [Aspergillus melleus]|uniref:uncharacterized protein n=1 Tax=Aspergillus melleus TaxID=138277 RepID=UPI001E8C9FDD|nr:uncharacterized protein LDX57_009815 [Aspergillus melleus]KAH8432174.1 hypothetical protein LDX57_009815 [Aspergillus melleus]
MHAAESIWQALKSVASWLLEVPKYIWNLLEKSTEEIHKTDQPLKDANQHIQMLEAELQACQMRLSRFIPDYQLSDTTIREKVIELQESVSNWAEEFPNDEDFQHSLDLAYGKFQFPKGTNTWGMEYPGWLFVAQSEILISITWWHICQTLFMPLVIASSDDLRVLQKLDTGITKIDPKKDQELVNLWRSDTIRAYVSGQQQQDYVQMKCSKLKAKLREIFGFFDFQFEFDEDHKFSSLEEQILIPAAELAIELSCSPEKYKWLWRMNNFPGCIVRKGHLDCFNIMDVATHNKISKNKYNHVHETAEIGKLLLVMFPAL